MAQDTTTSVKDSVCKVRDSGPIYTIGPEPSLREIEGMREEREKDYSLRSCFVL